MTRELFFGRSEEVTGKKNILALYRFWIANDTVMCRKLNSDSNGKWKNLIFILALIQISEYKMCRKLNSDSIGNTEI